METVPVVLRATEFPAPKNKREEIPKGKLFPKFLFSFWGFSSSCFLPHPGSSGREGRKSRGGDRDGWCEGHSKVSRKPGDPRLPELIPSPDSEGNWDLGGGNGIDGDHGDHGSGSAPSAALGDFLGIPTSGMSKFIHNSLWKCSLPKRH